jgi:hypothetical protein
MTENALGKKQNTKNFREGDFKYGTEARKIVGIYYCHILIQEHVNFFLFLSFQICQYKTPHFFHFNLSTFSHQH